MHIYQQKYFILPLHTIFSVAANNPEINVAKYPSFAPKQISFIFLLAHR
jgi:hypothetical protein